MNAEPRLIADCRCRTGEGVFWHYLRNEVFWFDIPGKTLYSANADGSNLRARTGDRMASAAGIIDRDTLVVGAEGGIFRYDLTTDTMTLLTPLEADIPGNRSNDGRVNPAGGLWISTMADNEQPYSGSVYQFRQGKLKKLFGDIRIANSTCFSPDGRTAYFTDTPNRIIMQRPIDPSTGEPAGYWTVFADTSTEPGMPDGAVIDAEGFLWSARWGGHRVIRYTPDGRVDREVVLPVSQVSCPGFGGPDLKTLFVTSARKNLDAAALEKEPLAGGLFAIDLDIAGQRETLVSI